MSETLEAIEAALPSSLTCQECDGTLGRGYLPVEETARGPEHDADNAVCDSCGWRDVGYLGCAPTSDDFENADRFVRIEAGDRGVELEDVTHGT